VQRILITGASSGIGYATAELFATKGWHVVANGRDPKKLETACKALRKTTKGDVEALAFDVREATQIDRAQRSHPEWLSELDVLVNNAGLARGLEPLQEGNPQEWDETFDTNVKGLLQVTRRVLPAMVKRGRGHVVNLGSTAGHWVYRGGAVYCASKFAVRALTEALRLDVHGTGVRVSSVDPGIVEGTDFSVVRFRGDQQRARKVYEGFQPLTPRDIAETIAWVVERPGHVNIQEVILTPTDQASVRDVQRKAAEGGRVP
jgi:3-hydroxy acid dehydrogenase / malonic semialdehyde reductase